MLQSWRKQLEQELCRQRLPRKQIERLVDELTDHAQDLLSGEHSMDAEQKLDSRMGSPEQLAQVARGEYIKSTFAARRPALAFIGVPLVTMFGTVVGLVVFFGVLSSFLDKMVGGSLSLQTKNAFVEFGSLLVRFVPFLFSTWLVVRFGRRSDRYTWSKIGIGLIVVAAFMFTSTVLPRVGETRGQWMLKLGIGESLNWSHVLQAAVPLAFGAAMIQRMSSPTTRQPGM